MTWRDYRSWIKSTTAGGMKDIKWQIFMSKLFASSTRMLPWISLWDALTGQVTNWLQEGDPYHDGSKAGMLDLFLFESFVKFFYTSPDAILFLQGHE